MPAWSVEQKRAIDTRNKNIIVSASAGSGKTTVLIARLTDLVCKQRIPITSILAMTFTEAAAVEMKKRLTSTLQKEYENAKGEDREFIEEQITAMSDANISTIHSFCLKLLQKYYYIVGLAPERINNIMDEQLSDLLKNQALDACISKEDEISDEIYIKLCEMFASRSENSDSLRTIIIALANMINLQSDKEKWIQEVRQLYCQTNYINDLPETMQKYFYDWLRSDLSGYEEQLLRLADSLKMLESNKKVDEAQACIVKKRSMIAILKDTLDKGDYMLYLSQLKACITNVIPSIPKQDEYKIFREDLHKLEDNMMKSYYSESIFIQDLHQLAPYIDKLCNVSLDYLKTYNDLKKLECVIDFDDMEHYAIEILKANNGYIANKLRNKFAQIMVDEFQDTNQLQNYLVELIARENNVFRVGDIKQSIYGFRHAKPDIMRNLIEHQGKNDEVIYLSNNFRSKKMIVDFNNALFEKLMNAKGLHKGFSHEDVAYVGLEKQSQDNEIVQYHLIDKDKIQKDEDLSEKELKASYIASKMIELKQQKGYQWKDMVVLTRSNDIQKDIKEQLDLQGVPCFVDAKDGFYQSKAVETILSALTAIDNPYDDIAFIAYLTSPVFPYYKQITSTYLSQIKINHQKEYDGYYLWLKDDVILKPFENLREQRNKLSLSELLSLLYRENDYYDYYTTKQDRVNLDLLFDNVVNFEQQSALGVHAFLTQIAKRKTSKVGEATSIGKDSDVVRIMSIHQSKGLQFPVVFLWGNHTPFKDKNIGLCSFDSDIGIGINMIQLPQRYVRKTLIRRIIDYKAIVGIIEEEMRILYVATTRAEKEMHIVDAFKSKKDLMKWQTPLEVGNILNKPGYSGWIIPLALNYPDLIKVDVVENIQSLDDVLLSEKAQHLIKRYDKPSKVISLNSASRYKKKRDISLVRNDNGMKYGSSLHKMAELMNNQEYTIENLEKVSQAAHITLGKGEYDRLMKLGHHLFYVKAREHQCYYELAYNVRMDGNIVNGYIDFLALVDDELWLVDYKSDRVEKAQELIDRYQQQLDTYAKACSILFPNYQIKKYLYSFALNDFISL